MHDARVLVVDDSAAMRALFSDVLDQAKNVRVVGAAANAAEARELIGELKPNVVTLDVEMPGMSGIDFLAEIMETNPLPVVMLSSLTQSGTETSLKAYDLGAVECFPKPLKATPEQFSKTVGKLGKIVLAGFPAQCPPTVITLQAEPALVETFVTRLSGELRCAVKLAKDDAQLTPGTVHIAADPQSHAVFEPGSPPRLRLVSRDPVDGARPSATLLFGTIARAGVPAVGAMLTGMGEDGARGLKLMREAGCHTFAQERATATVAEAPAAAIAAGAAEKELALADLAAAALACCSQA